MTIAAALAATDELCVCDLAWVTERAEYRLAASRRDRKMVLYRLTDIGRSLVDAHLAGTKARK